MAIDWDDYDYDPTCRECGYDPCECDIDVCQNCGRYFTWTADLRELWVKLWKPKPTERQPQRCKSCIRDETWCEGL